MTQALSRIQRRFALWMAFLSFYLTITGSATLSDLVSAKVAGALSLLGAALHAATSTWMLWAGMTGAPPGRHRLER